MKEKQLPFRDGTMLSHYHPSAWLLLAQLILLFLYAIFDGSHFERVLISIVGTVILVLAVWVIYRSSTVNWLAWVLALPALIFSLWTINSENSTILVLSSFFEAALYLYAAVGLIVYMMGDYQVTTDELFAAGATYTLLAWGFAYAYLIVETLVPGSFVGPLTANRSVTFIELLFVSFTNLSATGLSDIVPASTPARVMIMLEQFAGVGYVAVVISRLIGLMSQRQRRR
jgi:hypothetical protein